MPDTRRPRLGSLFTGYGGLDLAVMRTFDAELAWYAEIDDGASRVMQAHYPEVMNLGDVSEIDWDRRLTGLSGLFPTILEHVDIITAGYPCQPFSMAGLRKGEEDARHLWPHVRECLRTMGPELAILENVAGHLTLGFDQVLADLASIGFDAVWTVVRASEAGAPHRRTRLFVLASRRGASTLTYTGSQDGPQCDELPATQQSSPSRLDPSRPRVRGEAWSEYEPAIERWERVIGRTAPATSFLSTIGEVALNPAFVEWMMGLPEGWVTGRGLADTVCMAMLGNGVVPQQAELALRYLLVMRDEITPF